MPASEVPAADRRTFLSGAVVIAGLVAWPAGALAQGGATPVQRLLLTAAQRAFAKLSAPSGFWNSPVARFGLPTLFKKTAANVSGPLGQDSFRTELQYRLNILAESATRAAAPTVDAAARKLVVLDPQGVLSGKPSAASSALRLEVGSGLVNALIPTLEQTLLAAQDPVVAQAVTALAGVALRDVAHAVALAADNGIWYEIGRSEAEIRANPALANDPALAAALRPAPPAPSPMP